jgi:hypothetical protein
VALPRKTGVPHLYLTNLRGTTHWSRPDVGTGTLRAITRELTYLHWSRLLLR